MTPYALLLTSGLLLVWGGLLTRALRVERARGELARAAGIALRGDRDHVLRQRNQARIERDYHRSVSVELTEDLEHSETVIARLLDERDERRVVH